MDLTTLSNAVRQCLDAARQALRYATQAQTSAAQAAASAAATGSGGGGGSTTALQKSANLSDVASASTALANLGAVPAARKVNGYGLSADVTLAAADVGAVPTTRTVNGKPLSGNIALTAADVGATNTPPGGSSGQVQFNDAGAFNGASLTYDKTTGRLTTGPLVVNAPAPGNIIDLQSSGVSKFSMDQFGNTTTPAGFTLAIGVGAILGNNYLKGFNGYFLQWTSGSAAGTVDAAVGRDSARTVAVLNGTAGNYGDIKVRGQQYASPFTVATLPSASASDGMAYRVTDANAPALSATVAGGGATKAAVRSNGTNWIVVEIA